jgi:hypothetical protein
VGRSRYCNGMTEVRSFRNVAISAALISILVAMFVMRILGPARAPYDLDDCLRAYARAHTMADTLTVDNHPFPGIDGDSVRQCRVLRGTQ